MLRKGWLTTQFENTARDIAKWPDWMKNEVQKNNSTSQIDSDLHKTEDSQQNEHKEIKTS
jgi:hypothetical protein